MVGSPAAGEVRWVDEAAAAIGIEKQEMKREYVARRRVEVNSLAVMGLLRARR